MHDLQNEPLLVFPDGFPNQWVVNLGAALFAAEALYLTLSTSQYTHNAYILTHYEFIRQPRRALPDDSGRSAVCHHTPTGALVVHDRVGQTSGNIAFQPPAGS